MERQEIEVIVDKKGDVSLKVKGVTGRKCLDITKDIEQALGNVTSREMTSDANRQRTVKEARPIQGG